MVYMVKYQYAGSDDMPTQLQTLRLYSTPEGAEAFAYSMNNLIAEAYRKAKEQAGAEDPEWGEGFSLWNLAERLSIEVSKHSDTAISIGMVHYALQTFAVDPLYKGPCFAPPKGWRVHD